jgi:arsenical pump membrane protein
MLISIVADRAGFFAWCAVSRSSLRGKGPLLLLTVFGLGAVVTAFFSNDATALILTPIVFALVTRLKLDALPYVFACAFIANTASMLLPVSNPVNLLAVGEFRLTLGEYLKFLLLPSLLVIAVNVGLFYFIFRNSISRISRSHTAPPKVDDFYRGRQLAVTIVGYLLVSVYGLPLSYRP